MPPFYFYVTHYSERRVQSVLQRCRPHVLLMYRFFLIKVAISLAPTIVSPFPSVDSALVCLASTEATHIVLSEAFSNAHIFGSFTFCIADDPCDFSSTKETGHWALFIQIVA